MAEFEVFGSDNKNDEPKKKSGKKNLFKNKWFLIAVGVVSIIALIRLFGRQEETGQNMVIADGLEGVTVSQPVMDSGVQSAYSSGTFDAMYEAFTDQLTDIKNSYDIQIDSMSEQLYSFSNKLNTQDEILTAQSNTIAKQNDIQAMQNNSDAYLYATTDARKQALHNANQQIASKWGWTFDDNTGAWYDETGSRLYTTATQDYVSSSSSVSSKSSSTSVSKVKSVSTPSSASSDIATMKANSKAWHTASTQAEKDNLHAQNKAIAEKNNWTFNSSTGTYHDATGKQVY